MQLPREQTVPPSPPHTWLRAELDAARLSHPAELHTLCTDELLLPSSRPSIDSAHSQQLQQLEHVTEALASTVGMKQSLAGLAAPHAQCAGAVADAASLSQQHGMHAGTHHMSADIQVPAVSTQSPASHIWEMPQLAGQGHSRQHIQQQQQQQQQQRSGHNVQQQGQLQQAVNAVDQQHPQGRYGLQQQVLSGFAQQPQQGLQQQLQQPDQQDCGPDVHEQQQQAPARAPAQLHAGNHTLDLPCRQACFSMHVFDMALPLI